MSDKVKYLGNLGDVNPIEHGGYFIYQTTRDNGEIEYHAEKLDSPEEDILGATWRVYRFTLDRQKLVRLESMDRPYLVPYSWNDTYPHYISKYEEWFVKSLGEVASYVGSTKKGLELVLTSDDPLQLAWAYQCIGDFHGWANLNADCFLLTKKEVKQRYQKELK